MSRSLPVIEKQIMQLRHQAVAADDAGHVGELEWIQTQIDDLLIEWRHVKDMTS